MSRGGRARSSLEGLLKLLALVALAGGIGLGIGMVLAQFSDDDEQLPALAAGTGTAASTSAATPTTTTPARTATVPARTRPARRPPAHVRLRVLGAILRPAGTPAGRRRQRARLIMRLHARNNGARSASLGTPTLRVGSVRIRLDPAANPPKGRFRQLGASATKSFTLRYELAGDATPKVTRDRRARLHIGTRSVPLRVRIGEPVRPPRERPGA